MSRGVFSRVRGAEQRSGRSVRCSLVRSGHRASSRKVAEFGEAVQGVNSTGHSRYFEHWSPLANLALARFLSITGQNCCTVLWQRVESWPADLIGAAFCAAPLSHLNPN